MGMTTERIVNSSNFWIAIYGLPEMESRKNISRNSHHAGFSSLEISASTDKEFPALYFKAPQLLLSRGVKFTPGIFVRERLQRYSEGRQQARSSLFKKH